jgi:hypothetical protein
MGSMSPYIAAPWIRHGICCWVSYGFLWFLYGFLIVFRVRIVFASQGPDPIVEVRMLCWKRTNHGFIVIYIPWRYTQIWSWFLWRIKNSLTAWSECVCVIKRGLGNLRGLAMEVASLGESSKYCWWIVHCNVCRRVYHGIWLNYGLW